MATDTLSLIDVIENLTTIVDARSLEDIDVTETHHFFSKDREKEREQTVYWVAAGPNPETIEAMKATFKGVHKYLLTFYEEMQERGDATKLIEGINTIMVLVGEAAKKLEKFNTLFRTKLLDLPEYKNLENFYRNKIIKEAYQEYLEEKPAEERELTEEEWEERFEKILTEYELEGKEKEEGRALLNDFDLVKKDTLYELFYIRDESGLPFYTQELARAIKLACDFGEFSHEYFGEDPLIQLKNWEDHSLQLLAHKILKSCKKEIASFYNSALQHKDMELVLQFHNGLMALMLAANPHNLIRKYALKGCHEYFADFQFFLREALQNREYERLLLYSPYEGKPFLQSTLRLGLSLSYHLFTEGPWQSELAEKIKELALHHGHRKNEPLSTFFSESYRALHNALKVHPSGPLFKALDLLREEEIPHFDPLKLGNIPSFEASLKMGDKELYLLRIPCPTDQLEIHTAQVVEEFKCFLRELAFQKKELLIFNFQDRTSWLERARAVTLEEVGRFAEFSEVLKVVTFAKEADFYAQKGPYAALEEDFIALFQEQLKDESTGYHFPPELKRELFQGFIEELFSRMLSTLFDGREVLTLEERLNFIELSYLLIELKLMEIIHPTFMAHLSKDSLDIEGTATVEFLYMIKCLQNKQFTDQEQEHLLTLLVAPTLLYRERLVQEERFERMLLLMRFLEAKKGKLGKIAALFDPAVMEIEILFPILES